VEVLRSLWTSGLWHPGAPFPSGVEEHTGAIEHRSRKKRQCLNIRRTLHIVWICCLFPTQGPWAGAMQESKRMIGMGHCEATRLLTGPGGQRAPWGHCRPRPAGDRSQEQ
jgi:hypothetical protein